MSTSSLPDRLRALADLIESNNLPEPAQFAAGTSGATLHFDSHAEVCAWAEVSGQPVRVQDVPSFDGRAPFTAYTVDLDVEGWSYFSAVFYDKFEQGGTSAADKAAAREVNAQVPA